MANSTRLCKVQARGAPTPRPSKRPPRLQLHRQEVQSPQQFLSECIFSPINNAEETHTLLATLWESRAWYARTERLQGEAVTAVPAAMDNQLDEQRGNSQRLLSLMRIIQQRSDSKQASQRRPAFIRPGANTHQREANTARRKQEKIRRGILEKNG